MSVYNEKAFLSDVLNFKFRSFHVGYASGNIELVLKLLLKFLALDVLKGTLDENVFTIVMIEVLNPVFRKTNSKLCVSIVL